MSRYMFIARYESAGATEMLSEGGTALAADFEKTAADLGGRLQTFDFAFGEDDVYTLVELPDNKAAAAFSVAVNSSGMAHVRTVVLMTPQDIDSATHAVMPDEQVRPHHEATRSYGGARPSCWGPDDPADQIPDTLGTQGVES